MYLFWGLKHDDLVYRVSPYNSHIWLFLLSDYGCPGTLLIVPHITDKQKYTAVFSGCFLCHLKLEYNIHLTWIFR